MPDRRRNQGRNNRELMLRTPKATFQPRILLLASAIFLCLTLVASTPTTLPIVSWHGAVVPAPYVTIDSLSLEAPFNSTVPKYVQLNTALFGMSLPSGGATDILVIPAGEYGCIVDPLSQNLTASQERVQISGRIVLVKNSGGCNFVTKAENMAKLNARAVLVYDCPASEGCTSARKWPAASDKRPTIPLYMMEAVPGMRIRAAMLAGQQVTVTLPGTGNITAEDKQALKEVYAALGGFNPATRWSFYNIDKLTDSTIADKSGGLASWEQLNDDSLDPCVHRLFGITCVEGRITQIQCANCGIHSPFPLPAALGKLSELTYLNFNTNKLTGIIPCEIGTGLTRMNQLNLGSNSLTSMENSCLGNMVTLQELTLSSNVLSGIVPKEIFGLDTLNVLDLSSNDLTSLGPLDAPIMTVELTMLTSLNLASNALTGVLPSVVNLARLTTLDFRSNSFTSIEKSGFMNLPRLTSLYMQQNSISGGLPSLGSLPLLAVLALDNNNFTGPPSLPCSSTELQALTTFTLSHNSFTSPFTWAVCAKLAVIDASWNSFTAYSDSMSLTAEPASGKFFGDVLPPFITSVDFSHNSLAGGWVNNLFGRQTQLKTLKAAYNYITNLPSDLFTSTKYATLETIDLSHNSLSGEMPTGTPNSVLRIFKLDSNPDLVASAGLGTTMLPTYFIPSNENRVVYSGLALDGASGGGDYSCPTIEGKSTGFTVSLSPKFYQYIYCTCNLGTFGFPPVCTPFPTDVYLNDTSIGSLSDGAAGGRIRKGLDTYFYLYPSVPAESGSTDSNRDGAGLYAGSDTGAQAQQASSTGAYTSAYPYATHHSYTSQGLDQGGSIRRLLNVLPPTSMDSSVVSYKLNFSYFNFSDSNRDRLLIYNGIGTSTNPIYTFSEHSPPKDSVRPEDDGMLHIVAKELTIYFTSWSSEGQHFELVYQALDSYPEGYLPVAYELSRSLKIVAGVLIALTLLGLLSLFAFLYYHRHTRLMVASSPLFIYLTLLGSASLNIAGILFLLDASDNVCLARQWLGPLAFCLLLSPLFVKTHRLHAIYNMKRLAVKPISNGKLGLSIFAIMSPLLILLTITSSVPGERSHYVAPLAPALGNFFVPSCSNPEGLMYVSFTYLLLLTIWGSWLSWKVRNVPSIFNESSSIMNTILALLLYGCIIFPLQLLITDQPNALFVLRCIGYVLASWTSTGILYVPKLILLAVNGAAGSNTNDVKNVNKTYQESAISGVDEDLKNSSPLPGAQVIGAGPVRSTISHQKSGAFTGSGGSRKAANGVEPNSGHYQNGLLSSGSGFNSLPAVVFHDDTNADQQGHHSEEDRLAQAQLNAKIHASPTAVQRKVTLRITSPSNKQLLTPLSVVQEATRQSGGGGGQHSRAHSNSGIASPTSSLSELLTSFFENHPQLLEHSLVALGFTPPSPSDTLHVSSNAVLTCSQLRLIHSMAIKLTGEDPLEPQTPLFVRDTQPPTTSVIGEAPSSQAQDSYRSTLPSIFPATNSPASEPHVVLSGTVNQQHQPRGEDIPPVELTPQNGVDGAHGEVPGSVVSSTEQDESPERSDETQ